jgi:predicted DNA-binding antitoxin AbrB/MazE fold protein
MQNCLEGTRLRSILKVAAMTIPARYEKGVFRPLQEVPIKEGTVVEVCLPPETPAKRPPSIVDSPFAGIWKDREDMADSVEYIDRLRRELHG